MHEKPYSQSKLLISFGPPAVVDLAREATSGRERVVTGLLR